LEVLVNKYVVLSKYFILRKVYFSIEYNVHKFGKKGIFGACEGAL
jgi:hypothetical protein